MRTVFSIERICRFSGIAIVSLAGLMMPVAQGGAQESHNMRLVGFDDLQARSAYQPIVHHQGNRWIAYIGHHGGQSFNPLTGMNETNGTSIVDVTDPANPVYLHHIEGDSGAQMVRACDGDQLPNGTNGHTYLLRSNGNLEHQVFDVTDPSNPTLVSTPVTGLDGTHKSEWECSSGIAYLIGGVLNTTSVPSDPGGYGSWRTDRMMQVFDLSDPEHPQFIRNFGLDGQQPGALVEPVPQDMHGCLSVFPERQRVYCGYGTNSRGVVQILDRSVLLDVNGLTDDERKNPTTDLLNAPVVGQLDTPDFMGAHTTFPILDVEVENFTNDQPDGNLRDFVAVVNESLRNECSGERRQMVYFVDVTDEAKPWPVSSFDVRESDGDFCEVGGRFGSHSSNESFTEVFYRKLVFAAWFNAGVRAIDIRDPFNPKEAAYYIPRTTLNTAPRGDKIAIQTNNVDVDDRGFIYIVDRANTGMHILELTGDAKKIANLP